MKRKQGFWRALESYTWRRGRALTPTLFPTIVSIMAGALLLSLFTYFRTPTLTGLVNRRVVLGLAARGDYALAQRLYNLGTTGNAVVLGAASEVEAQIYPERVLETALAANLRLLERYPGHRDILVQTARIYEQLGQREHAAALWAEARYLDPNSQ